MKKQKFNLLLLLVAVFSTVSAMADTFVLNQIPHKLSDWKNGEFYEGGIAPTGSSEDSIAIPEDSTVFVDGDNDELMEFLSGCKIIYISNAVFSVSVSLDKVATLGCAIADSNTYSGLIEKTGKGELHLTAWKKRSDSPTSPSDYRVDIHVREGVLRLPESIHSTSSNYYNLYGSFTVDEGAKLISIRKSVWQVRGFFGSGTITNEANDVCDVYLTENWREKKPFYGVIGGKFNIQLRQNAYIDLRGVLNTYTSSSQGLIGSQANPVAYVAKFGDTQNDSSSIGVRASIASFSNGMRLVYTGPGETTHRSIYAVGSPAYLDAGANGGVVFAGDFATWESFKGNLQRHLVLDGSNRNECVIAGKFDPLGNCVRDGMTNQWYITKRGTGTWRFTGDDHKHLLGTFAVENGILAYDSMFEKGVACALGKSTRTYLYHIGAIDEEKRSDYAFELGCATNLSWTGLMEYRGSSPAQCLDRAFALVGQGGFVANSGAGVMRYANVTGEGEGARTFVLDGNSDLTNSVCNLRDGDGVISISKRGTGTWLLDGDVDVSGSVEVLGGTLIVRRPEQRYTRYRFTLKEIAAQNEKFAAMYGSTWTQTYGRWGMNEIGLFDKDGYRQNFHLQECANRAELSPGQAALATDRTVTKNDGRMSLSYIFDGVSNVALEDGNVVWNGFVAYIDQSNPPNRNKPDSWISIDMYLANDAHEISHYDINNMGLKYTDAYGGRTASAFALYGSVDGVNWDLLSGELDGPESLPSGNYYWLHSLKSLQAHDANIGTKHTDGWKLSKTSPDREFAILGNMKDVTVANGGSLVFEGENAPVISSLKIAADATGSISGFNFKADCVVELTGEVPTDGNIEIGVDLTKSTGLSDTSAWKVKANNKFTARTVRVIKNRLLLANHGLTVTLR